MLSDERGRRGSLGRVMASYRQPACSLDGHSAKWDFRKHQLCLCYHFCGMWLNILKEYLRFNLNLNNWIEPRFFLFFSSHAELFAVPEIVNSYCFMNGTSSRRISSEAVLLKMRIHRLWFFLCFANQISNLIVKVLSKFNFSTATITISLVINAGMTCIAFFVFGIVYT